jgi:hypothetical protein
LASQQHNRATERVSPIGAGQRRLDGNKIIWVDDQPNTTAATGAELQNEGASVEAVNSTEEIKAKLA